jgi:hypothetical protein
VDDIFISTLEELNIKEKTFKFIKMTDALGNEIVIGRTYAYTTENSGVIAVNIGTVTNFTPKNLVTVLIKRHRFQYSPNGEIADKTCTDGFNSGFKKTSVRAIKLFPI